MNTYFVRYKVDGQLIQDVVNAYSPEAAIRIIAMCREIPDEKIHIYAWRDAEGRLTRVEEQ